MMQPIRPIGATQPKKRNPQPSFFREGISQHAWAEVRFPRRTSFFAEYHVLADKRVQYIFVDL